MTINSLVIDGLKSFRDRTEVKLDDLTILSGANSSGKSTIMQSILLMKQTLESSYDPGPLLISGPNVVFSNTEQMFWTAPGEKREQICIGLYVKSKNKSGYEVSLQQQKGGTTPLQIVKGTWVSGQLRTDLSSSLTEEQRQKYEGLMKSDRFPKGLYDQDENLYTDPYIQRERFFLTVKFALRKRNNNNVMFEFGSEFLDDFQSEMMVENAVRSIIHVPGLRGNPRRTYPVTAVEKHFPGLFPDYVASVIAYWQSANKDKSKQLSSDLKELGLTWNVKARKTSDTEVEIQVARLPKGQQHGARDMVSIADVGFGVSQSLPVAVALLAAEPGELVYLEQPEIHLHPRAEHSLSRLIHRAVMRGVQVVVETHSELLLVGLQELMASKLFGKKKVIIHWVQRDKSGASILQSQELDSNGAFGNVPVDFGAVSFDAMSKYLEAAGEE